MYQTTICNIEGCGTNIDTITKHYRNKIYSFVMTQNLYRNSFLVLTDY